MGIELIRYDLYEHLCNILEAQLLLCSCDPECDPMDEPFILLLLHDINIVMNEA